ncbi:MAG TPA: LD-carboxypeptidase, partial [Chitinophagaceae bacterium]
TDRPFGKSIYELIHEHVKDYTYPICYNFPVSHERENYALKVGVSHSLKVGNEGVILSEE